MSANAAKGKIISLDGYRKEQLAKTTAPPPFDPQMVLQRITRARIAPSEEERQIASLLVLGDAEQMLGALQLMGSEILTFRQQIKAIAQQATDAATIVSVLLDHAGGKVVLDRDWFVAYEVPTGAGFTITEDDTTVTIAAIVDGRAPQLADLVSASQQTEG